jgi:hypothetical protein
MGAGMDSARKPTKAPRNRGACEQCQVRLRLVVARRDRGRGGRGDRSTDRIARSSRPRSARRRCAATQSGAATPSAESSWARVSGRQRSREIPAARWNAAAAQRLMIRPPRSRRRCRRPWARLGGLPSLPCGTRRRAPRRRRPGPPAGATSIPDAACHRQAPVQPHPGAPKRPCEPWVRWRRG